MNKQPGIFESDNRQNFMITSSKILDKLSYSSYSDVQNSMANKYSYPPNHSEASSKYSLSEVEIHESSRSEKSTQPRPNNYPSRSYPRNLRSTNKYIQEVSISGGIDYSPLISIKEEILPETGSPENQRSDSIPSYPSPKLTIKPASITYFSHDGYSESHDFGSDKHPNRKIKTNQNLRNNRHTEVEWKSDLSKSMFGGLNTSSILYPDRDFPQTSPTDSSGSDSSSEDIPNIEKYTITLRKSKINGPQSTSNSDNRASLLDIVIDPINQIVPYSLDQFEAQNIETIKSPINFPPYQTENNHPIHIAPKIEIIDLKMEDRKHQSRMLNAIIKIVSEGRSENHIQQLITERFDLGDIQLAQEIYQSKFKRIPTAPIERQYQLISSGRISSRRPNIARYSGVRREDRSGSVHLERMVKSPLLKNPLNPKTSKENLIMQILPLMSGRIPKTVIDPLGDINYPPSDIETDTGLIESINNSEQIVKDYPLPRNDNYRSPSPEIEQDLGNDKSEIYNDYEEEMFFQDNCPYAPPISDDGQDSSIPYQGTLSPIISVLSPTLSEQPFIFDSLHTPSPIPKINIPSPIPTTTPSGQIEGKTAKVDTISSPNDPTILLVTTPNPSGSEAKNLPSATINIQSVPSTIINIQSVPPKTIPIVEFGPLVKPLPQPPKPIVEFSPLKSEGPITDPSSDA